MGNVIGIIAIKGGVGKTTIAASLATVLAKKYSQKVLLVDANYSAPNVGLHMDIVEPEGTIHEVISGRRNIGDAIHSRFGVDIIPGSYVYGKAINPLRLKNKLKTLRPKYDFVILDSSPSLHEEILSSVLAADTLFVVSTPDYPTLSCSLMTAELAKKRGKKISGIILNKLKEPEFEVSLHDIEEVTGLPVIASISEDKHANRALFHRTPLPLYKPNSPLVQELSHLAAVLVNSSEPSSFWKRLSAGDLSREEVNRQLLRQALHGKKEELHAKKEDDISKLLK